MNKLFEGILLIAAGIFTFCISFFYLGKAYPKKEVEKSKHNLLVSGEDTVYIGNTTTVFSFDSSNKVTRTDISDSVAVFTIIPEEEAFPKNFLDSITQEKIDLWERSSGETDPVMRGRVEYDSNSFYLGGDSLIHFKEITSPVY